LGRPESLERGKLLAHNLRLPFVRFLIRFVRVACRYYNRRGRYRLDRLIAAHGKQLTLEALLTRLAADCTRASDRTSRPGGCRGPYLPDLGNDR